jgi:Protein of unknown function (DUF3040)
VSLSAWEQRNLDSIKDGLAGSDPGLATLLATFNQLASDEKMPVLEEIRVDRRLGLPWAALLLWLLVSISLITVGVVTSRGGQSACPRSWAVICVDSTTVGTSPPAPVGDRRGGR